MLLQMQLCNCSDVSWYQLAAVSSNQNEQTCATVLNFGLDELKNYLWSAQQRKLEQTWGQSLEWEWESRRKTQRRILRKQKLKSCDDGVVWDSSQLCVFSHKAKFVFLSIRIFQLHSYFLLVSRIHDALLFACWGSCCNCYWRCLWCHCYCRQRTGCSREALVLGAVKLASAVLEGHRVHY